jgi:hypothetical protein
MSTHSARLRFAPKVPVAWIVQLYRRDALQLQDGELVDKVGARLYARCLDILMVSDGLHQDLLGINARSAFAEFVEGYPETHGYPARMLLIDRLVHAVHASGGPAARNLLEGRPRQVLAILDTLAGRS